MRADVTGESMKTVIHLARDKPAVMITCNGCQKSYQQNLGVVAVTRGFPTKELAYCLASCANNHLH